MGLEEILAVLHSWLGREIEVGTHGSNGAQPVAAVEVRGYLRRGDELGGESASPGAFLFVLDDGDGKEVGSFRLYERALQGGGWFDEDEEVLEIRGGVIQILLSRVLD
jgi:hypothetical protein